MSAAILTEIGMAIKGELELTVLKPKRLTDTASGESKVNQLPDWLNDQPRHHDSRVVL